MPGLRNLDLLVSHGLARRHVSLLVGVTHDLGQVLRVERVQYVEEISSRRPLVLGEVVREVKHEGGILGHRWRELLHTQLVVSWDFDGGDGPLLEQLLLVREDGLEEVLVYLVLWRQVVL